MRSPLICLDLVLVIDRSRTTRRIAAAVTAFTFHHHHHHHRRLMASALRGCCPNLGPESLVFRGSSRGGGGGEA